MKTPYMPNSTEGNWSWRKRTMIDPSLAGTHSREDSEKRDPGVLYVICDERLISVHQRD